MKSTFRILSLSLCVGLATLWPQHMSAYAQEAVFGPAFGGAHGEDHVAGAKVWAKGVAGRQALARAPGVRAANAVGVFTTFDVPGAGTGGAQGTYPTAINPEGAITGWYADSNYGYHGFLRAAGGVFATFDAPGAVNGTIPASINPNGTIAGYFYDANFVDHGFAEPISRSSRETRSAVITGSSSGPATAPLPHSTRRLIRPAAYGRSLPASTRRKRSQGPSTTVTRSIMASCAPATAPSQPSTLRARAQEAPRPSASPRGV